MTETTYRLTCSEYYQHLMQPIAGDAPCGESLDYDLAFIMLQSRLQPRLDVEYGSFFEAAEPVNWAETERECLTLLQKSKDIRVMIILMRCRLRKVGLLALSEGIEALHALLHAWPNDLHPQLLDEGEFTPMLRANAFAELEDANGLLADLRNQPLPKASGLQITLKEFEKAHVVPREEGALSEAAVAALLHEWHLNARDDIAPLTQARHFLQEIKKTLRQALVHEAPELSVLDSLLGLFSSEFGTLPPVANAPLHNAPADRAGEEISLPAADAAPATVDSASIVMAPVPLCNVPETQRGIGSRADALQRLQEVRSWFAMTEPSSPLVPVLRYAEESIGKNFADLIKMYPPEIIAMLNQEKE
ncbi:type VI secretion system ImpA family N-terminal domain-containing protein [Enterobacteriaceae bacterium H18W14]|uniref:type VI secretion system protein TssA n=1 Tax=Dryocola boscaweniae TaxID=2925397 RepID=UPI0022F0D671|nr:type VI secretion system ImpA family N-terminal domain-containing protein [Dryocola boscaweniae]MCT4715761.1 type VI secretion system ImpA family N-terminal domain-containing protein [Dryocola boscaweniae]